MILVSREGYQPSERWLERAEREREEAGEWIAPDLERPSQGRFPFRVYRDPEIRDLLYEMFGGKCCYCESLLGERFDREQYRPKSSVLGLDGTVQAIGYWWLAMAWANYYAACAPCNRNKANRFPLVDESDRAKSPNDDLSAERPLLLDPCATDEWLDPDLYLVFSEDGLVASSFGTAWQSPSSDPAGTGQESFDDFRWQRFGQIDPGQVTIDVIGLNRRELVERRKQVAEMVRLRIEADLQSPGTSDLETYDAAYAELVDPTGEYVLLQRQLLRQAAWDAYQAVHDMSGRGTGTGWSSDLSDKGAEVLTKIRFEEDRQRMLDEQRSYQETLAGTSVDDDSTAHYSRTSRLDRVVLRNFRCFEALDFSFGSGSADRAGWKMLLGENGVGKSTMLQAVALALMGARNFDRLVALGDLDPASLRRRGASADEAAFVEVWLGADVEPRRMTLHPDGTVEFSSHAQGGARTVLLGFGSARWLYREGGFPPDDDHTIRVRNLFNPFVPLGDTVSWLRGLDEAGFEAAQLPILNLLGFTAGQRLDRDASPTTVLVAHPDFPPDQWVPLTELSDGYQTVLAMTGDIIELLTRQFGSTIAAEGVVLVDEIGAHLHPRWMMRVVSRLRDAFPQVQFLATTHEPLCLRGLEDGEIMVVRRNDEGDIEVLDDLPSVDDLRIDQLLTSELFGLHTTLDPDTEDQLNRYYDLLARRDDLTADEQAELATLQDEVGGSGMLGTTKRDRMIYAAMEQLAVQEQRAGGEPIGLREETKRQVAELWAELDS